MCQLLGMNCNAPTDVTFSFRGFAQRGGHTDQHADGWGIAFFEGDGSAGGDKGLRHFVDHLPACGQWPAYSDLARPQARSSVALDRQFVCNGLLAS